jgi:hypothetical protein
MPFFIILVMPHSDICRAKGRSVGIESEAAIVQEMRQGVFGYSSKRNNRCDALLLEVAIMGVGVVMAVAAKDRDIAVEPVFASCLEEGMESPQRPSEVIS